MVFIRRLNCPRLSDDQIVLVRLAKSSTLVGQQRQNTGRRSWSVYVGRRRSQSQTNGVDADGRRRQVDSHLPSKTVPGHLDTGRPGQRRCVLEQKLLLRAYRKSYEKLIGTKMNALDLCLEVVYQFSLASKQEANLQRESVFCKLIQEARGLGLG